jgi:hypothetical protein
MTPPNPRPAMMITIWRGSGEVGGNSEMNRGLRRECAERVRRLEIPTPFDVQELCRRLGAQRGREIRLLPAPLPPESPCGLWVSTDHADYVFYEERTSQLHREHIVLHEIGHLLCDHEATPVLDDEASRLVMPSLDPGMVQRMLGRTHYSRLEERQAELMASLIREQASRWSPEPTWTVPAEAADVAARLEHSLKYQTHRPEQG